MAELIVRDLSVNAADANLVSSASLSIRSGELVVLLGPNGAGKTSLLRGMLGLLRPSAGHVELNGQQLSSFSSTDRARQIAYLPQIRPLAWPTPVKDVVALGRYAHGAAPSRLSGKDAEAVDRALDVCKLTGLKDRASDTLSGGELARMHFARALAAETPLLIADEPVAALDPRHQFGVMDLVANYVKQGGGALVILHDIALAARYATRLVWMQHGEIIADGSVDDTLTPERLEVVYGVTATITGRQVLLQGPTV